MTAFPVADILERQSTISRLHPVGFADVIAASSPSSSRDLRSSSPTSGCDERQIAAPLTGCSQVRAGMRPLERKSATARSERSSKTAGTTSSAG
eukprot:2352520-Pleurochrysis_carterae.AAC.1